MKKSTQRIFIKSIYVLIVTTVVWMGIVVAQTFDPLDWGANGPQDGDTLSYNMMQDVWKLLEPLNKAAKTTEDTTGTPSTWRLESKRAVVAGDPALTFVTKGYVDGALDVYKCPADASHCGAGSWTYSTCGGQITTESRCKRVTWNSGSNTCYDDCTYLGKLKIFP